MTIKPNQPVIVVLIVVHNRLDNTSKCLASIPGAASGFRVQLLIVDDGSVDGTADWVRNRHPNARILRGDGSLWFGGGVQAGIDYIKSEFHDVEYVLSLNNDVQMLPGCVEALITQSKGEYVVSAMLTDEKVNLIHSFGTIWHWWKGWVCPYSGKILNDFPEIKAGITIDSDLLTTAVTLIPFKWLRGLPSINVERYPQHKADTCLFSKISRAGAKLKACSGAVAVSDDTGVRRRRARDCAFGEFLFESLFNKYSPLHFPSTVSSLWETAPSRLSAILAISRAVLLYARTLALLPFYLAVTKGWGGFIRLRIL